MTFESVVQAKGSESSDFEFVIGPEDAFVVDIHAERLPQWWLRRIPLVAEQDRYVRAVLAEALRSGRQRQRTVRFGARCQEHVNVAEFERERDGDVGLMPAGQHRRAVEPAVHRRIVEA